MSTNLDLTDGWENRGINDKKDFAILTNEISKATFNKTFSEYKRLKGLNKPNQNLRDHMTNWELIFTMLGKKASTDITKTRNAKRFNECKDSAKRGGEIAQNARNELEQETKKSIISKENYLHLDSKEKKKKLLKKEK